MLCPTQPTLETYIRGANLAYDNGVTTAYFSCLPPLLVLHPLPLPPEAILPPLYTESNGPLGLIYGSCT
eukprot:1032806-Prorocentrum_minimum.AAC.1